MPIESTSVPLEKFFDNSVRISSVIHCKSLGDSCYISAFEDFVCDYLYCSDRVLDHYPTLKKELADDLELEEVVDCMREDDEELTGILVRMDTPVKSYVAEGAATMSWGCYRQDWTWAADIADAERQAIEWAKEQDRVARQDYMEKQGKGE
ncbi:hypothetical protein [Halodesulfovibrio sp.]|jgi:hypothetical protein|uniref:hypothetical protein n=1 Tax=Halodesulfovibrio sp. TaxID=1912772 RepID=UPI0025E5F954|nr:hypothetical protein [Halodesulfovibrio sp.]MCT4625839.1 hypothetical protein [Halodesulfovibrio sp.]